MKPHHDDYESKQNTNGGDEQETMSWIMIALYVVFFTAVLFIVISAIRVVWTAYRDRGMIQDDVDQLPVPAFDAQAVPHPPPAPGRPTYKQLKTFTIIRRLNKNILCTLSRYSL